MTLSFLAVGDIHLNRPDPLTGFRPFAEMIHSADVALFDLEGPCTDQGGPMIGKMISMRMPVNAIPALRQVGFHVAVLSNNHMLDYGYVGMDDTLRRLNEAGIIPIGAGHNLDEARRPVILERNGLRLGILSYTTTIPYNYDALPDRPGVAPIHVKTYYEPRYILMTEEPGLPAKVINVIDPEDLGFLQQQIRQLKKETDAVVVSLHWGVGYYVDQVPYQSELGHAVVDAGADLVVGHHSHTLQGVEVYHGVPIFYSLSHSFYDRENPRFGHEMVLLSARFGAKGLERTSVRPALLITRGEPRPLEPHEREPFQRQLELLSAGMHSRFEWDGADLVVLPEG